MNSIITFLVVALFISVCTITIISVGLGIGYNVGPTFAKHVTGAKGDQGVCNLTNLSDTGQLVVSGNFLSFNTTTTMLNIISPSTDLTDTINIDEDTLYGRIYIDDERECLAINSSNGICFDIGSNNFVNSSIFKFILFGNKSYITHNDNDPNNEEIVLYSDFISFIGKLKVPLFIGNNGGILDEIPSSEGGGLIIHSNPNSSGGIILNSNGGGISGEETFNNMLSFLDKLNFFNITNHFVLDSTDDLHALTTIGFDKFVLSSNLTTFNIVSDVLTMVSRRFLMKLKSVGELLIESTKNLTISILDSSHIFHLNVTKYKTGSWYYQSNISLDASINSKSNQIGFYNLNNGTTELSNSPSSNMTLSNNPDGWIRFSSNCISIGPVSCISDLIVNSLLTIKTGASLLLESGASFVAPNFTISGNMFVLGNLTVSNFSILDVFSLNNIHIIGTSLLNTLVVSGNANLFLLNVGSGGLTMSSGSPFYNDGLATFDGSTMFTGNVSFSPGIGGKISCSTPLFKPDSLSDPTPSPCIPECLDFSRCNLNARSINLKYGISVAKEYDSSDILDTVSQRIVSLGSVIDFLSSTMSYLELLLVYSNAIEITSNYTTDIYSKESIIIGSENRTTMYSINRIGTEVTTPTSSCISYITLYDNTSGTPLPVVIPIFNYTGSTCTSMKENFTFTNHTVSKDSVFSGSVLVERTCDGPYCTPFFELFTKHFPLLETLHSSGTFNRGYFELTLDELSKVFTYLTSFVTINQTLESGTNALLAIPNASLSTEDSFQVKTFAYSIYNGSQGTVTIDASSTILLGQESTHFASLDTSTGNFRISGDLLDKDGNIHSCCVDEPAPSIPSSFAKHFVKLTMEEGNITVNVSGGNHIPFNLSGIGSVVTTGSSTPFIESLDLSSLTFTVVNTSFFSISSGVSFQHDNILNVDYVSCVYVLNSNQFLFSYSSPLSFIPIITPSGGAKRYKFSCGGETLVHMTNGDTVQLKIMTSQDYDSTHNFELSVIDFYLQIVDIQSNYL